MLECSNLFYEIDRQPLIRDLSWRFTPEKITAIIGPNGAGKSTLLKLLLGLTKPTSGLITLQQQPLTDWSLGALAAKRAYISQQSVTLIRLPVFEYLGLSRIQRRESIQQRDQHVNDVIHKLELHDLARKSVDTLSGGEFQRVELARVWCQLLHENSVANTLLVLDEPTSALDIRQTERLYQNLQIFAQNGGTVIIVEHNINQAARYCNELIMLKLGECIAAGNTQDIFTQENINSCFNVQGHLLKNQHTSSMTFSL